MNFRTWIFGVLIWSLPVLISQAAEPQAEELAKLPAAAKRTVDFTKDIQPLLAKRCFECHGADTQEAGLRLDLKIKALAGADSGPVLVSGQSAKSRLIHLVAGLDQEVGRMPPEDSGDALTAEQIGLLRAWIDQGLAWPDDAAGDTASSAWAKHWSFLPIARPDIPKVVNAGWIRNPIDAFILAKLEHENVAPAPEADRTTLMRRVYLDLLGLSPSEEEVRIFLADRRADAYEQMVDRALDSPHYGERWGRHWLDVARYADSDGYEKDLGRPFAWRYRDWIIEATNRDMPFDVFSVQQLAGDLLKKSDPEYDSSARVAAGFHRNTLINKEGGVDPEEDRVKRTIDRTNTLGSVWLGLTVGCANCHTHKYDPITQREYFELYAFFNSLTEVDRSATPGEMTEITADATPREEVPEDGRSRPTADVPSPGPAAEVAKQKRADTLFQSVSDLKKPRATYVHLRGDFLAEGPTVEPHTPQFLPTLTTRGKHSDRLDLARWVVAKDNPLTARVIVNRIWQLHFGRGIVPTIDDFGTQGDPPSHPELLDWLAGDLRDNGWKLKRLHRLIVTSATYRQSAAARPELAHRDPYNQWLARQNRLRVEAEIVRDLALDAAGLLNPAVGGPSVRPPQPAGVADLTYAGGSKWTETKGPDRYRRGLYIWFQRTSPYPSLTTFDAPESILACTRRERSDTPLQALTLLNDVVYAECSRALGQRIFESEARNSPTGGHAGERIDARIRYGVRVALSRAPTASETRTLRDLYDAACDVRRADLAAKQKLGGNTQESDAVADEDRVEVAGCVAVARALLNLDEFITRE